MSITSMIKRIINALARRSYWYNNIMFPECEKFWNHSTFGMDVVNLGSSSALAAFDYSAYPHLKAANWAMAPQSFVGDYEILRNYSCYLRPGSVVIIPLCPFSCLGGSNENLPDKYYTVLDIASIPHASYIKRSHVLHVKQTPGLYIPFVELFLRHKKKTDNDLNDDEMEKDAQLHMESWRKEFSIYRFSDSLSLINVDAYNDGVALLSEMIDYCIERSFRPVLVMPPVSKMLQNHFTGEMKNMFIDEFVHKCNKDKAIFLDFFSDSRFSGDCFQNSFLLNKKGAHKLTELVLKELFEN